MPLPSTEKGFPLPHPPRLHTPLDREDEAGKFLYPLRWLHFRAIQNLVEPVVDDYHPNSITVYSPSFHGAIVGAVCMNDGSDATWRWAT